jgi:hypothetical protein
MSIAPKNQLECSALGDIVTGVRYLRCNLMSEIVTRGIVIIQSYRGSNCVHQKIVQIVLRYN